MPENLNKNQIEVIENFLKRYTREYDYYLEAARLCAQACETGLEQMGIRCIVTFRAKRPDRLRSKIEKRFKEKDYNTAEDIYKDIVDLSGVRIALYFPGDREEIDKFIQSQFEQKSKKEFPEIISQVNYNKRFSGYWASHYRVLLRKENLSKEQVRYTNAYIEIQVASVLMHAWAEVGHDLVYKPFSGELSEGELSILDELNGLVLAGEIALERLQKAVAERVSRREIFHNQYELVAFLKDTLKQFNIDADTNFLVTRADILLKFLQLAGIDNPEQLKRFVLEQAKLKQLVEYYSKTVNLLQEEKNSESVPNRENIEKTMQNVANEFQSWWSVEDKASDFKNRGRLDIADKVYSDGIKNFPESDNLLGNYAFFAYKHLRDFDKAEELFKKAIQINSNHSNNLGNYAKFLYLIRKNHDDAENYFDRSYKSDSRLALHLSNYARFLEYARGNYSKAEELYKEAVKSKRRDATILSRYANFLLHRKHNNAETEQLYLESIELEGDNAEALGGYANFLASEGRMEQALEYYRRSILIYMPEFKYNLDNYMSFLKNSGKSMTTLDVIRKFISNVDNIDLLKELIFVDFFLNLDKKNREQNLQVLKILIELGIRIQNIDFINYIIKANNNSSPENSFLVCLAKVITGEEHSHELDNFDDWKRL